MAVETQYNTNFSSPTNTGRVEFTNVGSGIFQIYGSGQTGFAPVDFKASTLEIWTAASGGTQLTVNTDYTLEYLNEELTSKAGYGTGDGVYAGLKVITGGYQTGSIWIDCDIVGSETAADVINNLQSQISALSSGSKLFDIYNCELSNGTDTDHDIDIATGFCIDSTLTYQMTLSSGLTKQIDATWAAGTGNGGLFSGTVAADTTYHVFLIRKNSDGSIDAGFDTSVTATNIPTGYTAYRRIGSIITDSSANIIQFNHTWQDKMFRLKDRIITQAGFAVATSATLYAFSVPTGINVKPIGRFTPGISASGSLYFDIYSYNESYSSSTIGDERFATFDASVGSTQTGTYEVGSQGFQIDGQYTANTSGQIYFKRYGSYFSATYYSTLQTYGWIDYTL